MTAFQNAQGTLTQGPVLSSPGGVYLCEFFV